MLHYDGLPERIEVSRFIVREEEIAFELTSDSELGGHWHFSGVAKKVPNGKYVAPRQVGREVVGSTKEGESIPYTFVFEVGPLTQHEVAVKGCWSADGEIASFSGTLGPFSPKAARPSSKKRRRCA